MKFLKLFFVLCLGIGMFIFFRFALTQNPNNHPSPLIGKPVQEFSVRIIANAPQLASHLGGVVMENSALQSSNLKGFWVVLNFWASWCQSCAEEAKILEAFSEKHKDDKVLVLGVAVQDREDDAITHAKELGKTYGVAIDDSGKLSVHFGVTGVPETFLINPEGVVMKRYIGPVLLSELEDDVGGIIQKGGSQL